MEDLITHAYVLFDEHGAQHSPPLPPTPAGEPVPQITYGSKNTKVASVPPTPTSSRLGPEDFTPRLPPRPANSIHPSLRANTSSPTKDRFDLPPPLPLRPRDKFDDDTPPSPSVASTAGETIASTDESSSSYGEPLNEGSQTFQEPPSSSLHPPWPTSGPEPQQPHSQPSSVSDKP